MLRAVPPLPIVAEPGTTMHLYLNESLSRIDFGFDNSAVPHFKYILAWIKRLDVQMDIYQARLVNKIPNETEFFEMCAESLIGEEAVPQEEFMKWIPWIAENIRYSH